MKRSLALCALLPLLLPLPLPVLAEPLPAAPSAAAPSPAGAPAAVAPRWRDEPAVAALFRQAGLEGTFVLFDPRTGELRGHNPRRADQRFSPASTFKIANALIGLSAGAVSGVDQTIPIRVDPAPLMREWLEPMGLRGAMRVSNVPLFQELARRIGLVPMREAVRRLHYGNTEVGNDVTTFWLRGPLAISALEQICFLARLAHQTLPMPRRVQQQVAEITLQEQGPGWSLHAKTGWQNAPGPGVGWWVGWVRRGDQITPFALNIDIRSAADGPRRQELGRASLVMLGVLPAAPIRPAAGSALPPPQRRSPAP